MRIATASRVAGKWSDGLAELADDLAAIADRRGLADAGRRVAELLGSDDVALMQVRGDSLVELLSAHPGFAPGSSWSLGEYPATALRLADGRPGQVIAGDPLGDPHELAELAALGYGSMLMVPIRLDSGGDALMEVYRVRPQAFSRAQIERARVVALQLRAVLARVTGR